VLARWLRLDVLANNKQQSWMATATKPHVAGNQKATKQRYQWAIKPRSLAQVVELRPQWSQTEKGAVHQPQLFQLLLTSRMGTRQVWVWRHFACSRSFDRVLRINSDLRAVQETAERLFLLPTGLHKGLIQHHSQKPIPPSRTV
jgi:hypothetical protein